MFLNNVSVYSKIKMEFWFKVDHFFFFFFIEKRGKNWANATPIFGLWGRHKFCSFANIWLPGLSLDFWFVGSPPILSIYKYGIFEFLDSALIFGLWGRHKFCPFASMGYLSAWTVIGLLLNPLPLPSSSWTIIGHLLNILLHFSFAPSDHILFFFFFLSEEEKETGYYRVNSFKKLIILTNASNNNFIRW